MTDRIPTGGLPHGPESDGDVGLPQDLSVSVETGPGYRPIWRKVQLAMIITAAAFFGASLIASVVGIWWATLVAAGMASVVFLVTSPRRWHDWSCEICQAVGITVAVRCRSQRDMRKLRDIHMRWSHNR